MRCICDRDVLLFYVYYRDTGTFLTVQKIHEKETLIRKVMPNCPCTKKLLGNKGLRGIEIPIFILKV